MEENNRDEADINHDKAEQGRPKRGRKTSKIKGTDPRQIESPLQRMQRLELQRLRAAKSRNCETEEQRLKRLKANRERIARIRDNETEEQRQQRLKKQRERIRELRKFAKDSERKKIREIQKQTLLENRDKRIAELDARIKELNAMQRSLKTKQQRIEILVSNSLLAEQDALLPERVVTLPENNEAYIEKTAETDEIDVLTNDDFSDTSGGTRVCIFTVCQKCGANTWNEDCSNVFCKNCRKEPQAKDDKQLDKEDVVIDLSISKKES